MNFFVRPKEMKKVSSSYVPEKDIVKYERKDKLVKADSEDDFVVEEVAVEVERVNRQEYIDSFREDVGIANILKKVALSGDASLLNQVKRQPLPIADDGKEVIQDITPLQAGEDAVAKMGDNMRKTFADLPDELKAGRSLEQFCETCSKAEIDAFVASYIEKKKGDNK